MVPIDSNHVTGSRSNRENVIKQFLKKLPPSKKGAKFDLSDLLK